MKYNAVVFDLDGTLINTLPDLTSAMNYGLRHLDQPERTEAECRKMIGNGLRMFVKRALPDTRQDLVDDLFDLMRVRYIHHCCNDTFVYEGMTESLGMIQKMGISMAILTNKQQDQANKVVGHYFREGLFEAIIGARDGRAIKPDPEAALEVARSLGVMADKCVFVGDSDVDMQTGKAAGMLAVGVGWGYRSVAELNAAGADVVLSEPKEIIGLLS